MFMFSRYALLSTSLLSSVLALPLASRDVVAPPITSPTANTVWHVGETQSVTWNTSGLPVNQTNPVGMLILGYVYNNSENLMLDSPLATNLNYSVGQAQITVPNVPTGTNYIVVLFGDSGNASPEFTIMNDASSSTSVPLLPAPTSSPAPSPTVPTPTLTSTPSPTNTNSLDGSGNSSPASAIASSGSLVVPVSAAPPSQTTSSRSSTAVTVTSTITPSSTQSSAAWQKHAPSLGTSLSVTLAFIYFTFS